MRFPIPFDPANEATFPPRAEVVRSVVNPGRREVTIQFDADWGGGRGCWFDERNHAVAESAIIEWYPNK